MLGVFRLFLEGVQGLFFLAVVRRKHIHPSDRRSYHAGNKTDTGADECCP
nr:MAG TPA: hypothetical protein [Caudoviricetes sp.]